jgi:hypothetical protein
VGFPDTSSEKRHECRAPAAGAMRSNRCCNADFEVGVSDRCQGALVFLKLEFAVVSYDLDSVARLEIANEELRGQRIEQEILNRPLQRPGPELRVIAFFGD